MDWSSPMDTMIRSNTGSSEVSEVGMSMPHWNMYCSRPTVLRHTDLPPALGPEIRRMCFSGVRVAVRGTIGRPSLRRAFSSSGWRAFRSSSSPFSDRMGMPAMKSRATPAFAIRKSISPRKIAAAERSGIQGRRNSENSCRMRAISRVSANRSSAISLVRATISAGSTKVVLPVADSS